MIFDPEQISAATQRHVFLTVIQALARMKPPEDPSQMPGHHGLGATLDGLLDVIACLLVEARVLPDAAAEREICDDLRDALLAHIQANRAEVELAGNPARH